MPRENAHDTWARYPAGAIPSTVPTHPVLFGGLEHGRPIVDLGCGTGRVVAELHERGYGPVVGLDINPAAIDLARKRLPPGADARFEVADARHTGQPEAGFAFAILQAVMTTLPSPEDRLAVLDETRRILATDGRLYLAVFMQTHDDPTMQARYVEGERETGERGSFHVLAQDNETVLYRAHHYDKQELESLLTSAGFVIDSLDDETFTTRSGNRASGALIWARSPR